MTDEEIEVVAEELAKCGGLSWYPGRTPGPLMPLVTDRYREQARVVIAALDQLRMGEGTSQRSDERRDGPPGTSRRGSVSDVRPGVTIIYCSLGDQRAYPCRIVKVQGDRASLAPILRTCVGWVSIQRLEASTDEKALGR
jgi:hypothetical protein